MRHLARGGTYVRVADPDWQDPLSPDHAQRRGGRWNAPDSFGVVYLNRTVEVARELVRTRLEARGLRAEDLRDDRGPVLVRTNVPEDRYVDAVSDRGLASAGLPRTYPLDAAGAPISHARCQAIGQSAWDGGEPGIACRSAAALFEGAEELAFFARRRLRKAGVQPFGDWYL